MKIKELIGILNTYDQEANIYIDLGGVSTPPWDFNVKDFNFTLVEKHIDSELKKVAGRPCKETSNSKKGIIIYVE
jgi:hypothetical protein